MAQPAVAAPFVPCADAPGIECMTVTVPLDRSGALKNTVDLAVRRSPARTGPASGAVMFIAGGPGQAATVALPTLADQIHATLPSVDVLTFDQRGTGRSGPLRCAADVLPSRRSPTEIGAACGAQLGPVRQFYRSTESADDVEAVRQATGAGPVAIFAVSYGARVAGEYARRYPAAVSRLVLDSATPLAGTDPLDTQRLRALPNVFRSLCAGRACGFTRSPYGDLRRLATRLRRRPLRGSVFDARGRPRRVRFTLRDLYGVTISSDLAPSLRGALPSSISSALRGDEAPLLRTLAAPGLRAAKAQERVEELNFTTNRVVLCSESPFPWNPASRPNRRRDAALRRSVARLGSRFAPFGPNVVVGLGTSTPDCLRWPAVVPPVASNAPGPAVPTLVLSGSEDIRTPLDGARGVAGGFPGGRVLEVPYTGHSTVGADVSGCAPAAAFAFLGGGPVGAACPPRPRLIPTAPRAPRALRALKPFGLRGRRGRTLRAVIRTLDDALAQIVDSSGSVRLGGLRGGRLRFSARAGRVGLTAYRYVPGVRVRGVLRLRSGPILAGRLRVAGGGAVPGTISVSSTGRVRARFRGARGAATSAALRIEPRRLVRAPRIVAPGP